MSKLLVSPLYFKPPSGNPPERFGRSFFREDLGFGEIETSSGELRSMFGRIRLFDLKGLDVVTLSADFSDDPVGIVDDELAPGVIERAVENSLRAFPGAPPSIYVRD